jgi:hypothetical protein
MQSFISKILVAGGADSALGTPGEIGEALFDIFFGRD